MNSKTYPLPDPTDVAAKIAAAGGPQIDVSKPTGAASAHTVLGTVTLSWVIDAGSIVVTVAKKPWDMSLNTIWEHVDPLFA